MNLHKDVDKGVGLVSITSYILTGSNMHDAG